MTSAVRLVLNNSWASVGLGGGLKWPFGAVKGGVSGTRMGGTYHNGGRSGVCVYKGGVGISREEEGGRTGICERRDQPQWQAGPVDWRWSGGGL